MDIDTGYKNFLRLLEEFPETDKDLNEAETRFLFIDRLLQDCLGWHGLDIDVERYSSGDYTDYELGKPAKKLVIEAKRIGKYFSIPAGVESTKLVSINNIGKASDDARTAIIQAITYCKDRGIAVGAVCNGSQLIVFLGSRLDGISPNDGHCFVFDSRESRNKDFPHLWNLISKAGTSKNAATHMLSNDVLTPPPPKMSSYIADYPGYKKRNAAATDLQILGGLFLEDIATIPEYREDFVRDTYCASGALSQYALVSKEILAARYNLYFQSEQGISAAPARGRKGIDPALKQDLIAASITSRPILLVGGTGVGKSMFIQHLVLVDARDELANSVVVRIDFGSQPVFAKDLEEYARIECERQLLEIHSININESAFVRRVYKKEIALFSAGVMGELQSANPDKYREKEIDYVAALVNSTDRHLEHVISYLVHHNNKSVVIFLDNVDQRPIDFQEKVFLIGQAFAASMPATVFIALRPETFAFSRIEGSLTAYQPRVFTIEPPRVEKVVSKRLHYGLKRLRETGTLPTLKSAIHLTSNRLDLYMNMLLDACEHSEELMRFLDNMSNGNLRKALDFITVFVGSGHVDSEKIFRILEAKNRYTLPLHEFLRAVLHDDNRYFDPKTSRILNVYDLTSNTPREHFLIPCMLACVERSANDLSSEGFVSTDFIFSQLQAASFTEQSIRIALDRCISKDLLSPPKIYKNSIIERVRINTAGAYTYKILVRLFTYTDAIIVDTPITNDHFRKQLRDVEPIFDRLERVKIFASYLDDCWDDQLGEMFPWPNVKTSLLDDVQKITERIG